MLAAAALPIAAGVVALVIRTRAAGRFGWAGRWGLGLGVAGAVALAAALIIQGVFYDDFPHMPTVVIPAGLALGGGFLLVAAVLRVVPRWAGAMLVVGAFALIGVNDQTERILLAIPFGIGWMAVGYALWRWAVECGWCST